MQLDSNHSNQFGDLENQKETLDIAVENLRNGKLIAYPTDTLYGFGVDATNSEAITRLNILKGRTQPLSIILGNINDIQKYAYATEELLIIISKYLPGPYTILLKKKKIKFI